MMECFQVHSVISKLIVYSNKWNNITSKFSKLICVTSLMIVFLTFCFQLTSPTFISKWISKWFTTKFQKIKKDFIFFNKTKVAFFTKIISISWIPNLTVSCFNPSWMHVLASMVDQLRNLVWGQVPTWHQGWTIRS